MANKIILKKTSTAAKVPLSTDLEIGEIAVNLADQKLYSKDAAGTVILVGSGTAAPAVTYTTNYVPFGQGTTTPDQSASFTYTTGTGALRAPAVEASNGLLVNNMTITDNYDIPSGYSASSVGPMVALSSASITVPSGSRWVVL
jgi:hypothetical protein